ncbi:ORC-CDC6 family AAA ATPase [Cupriavidus taiwanensis]|uniref:Uncharacterized protein n=1 Tax=Cupriavidus taiwanensis TaxID=164546 RepID=A0A7Z7NR77_9BURK|nr:hypothetical protein [Cupriavidus taiwanensis]SOZ95940.1 conserved hypothetical protein [Cupriavidus taiwanensis]SPC25413.1 conserved hypothetical protein [Cupriavidus taiwanensis]SPD37657.1 conserved protein of unknown function [Cupriavidus taiwanensis]
MSSNKEAVQQLFGDYRAEWSQPDFASLFTPPPYSEKLVHARPSFLVGGRGTGKTTALRSLRFDAAHARSQAGEASAHHLSHYGIYVRINKNRVRAFSVTELSANDRQRAFAHYFNILTCIELCQLCSWLERDRPSGKRIAVEPVAATFGLKDVNDPRRLQAALTDGLTALELYVNNGGRTTPPVLSANDAPLKMFAAVLSDAGYLDNKLLFCCIDEYENLAVEQQSMLNAYIKHSEPPLSYKIGMRREGLKTHHTLDEGDQLSTPDDYAIIDIAEERFDTFAESVANQRLSSAKKRGVPVHESLTDFLPEMSFEEEAKELGCARVAAHAALALRDAPADLQDWFSSLPPTKAYFLQYWHESSNEPVIALAKNWRENPSEWDTRLGNYGYSSLFWLSKGRKGARIRKYYAGVGTFLALASGNIRFFLELIDEAIQAQLELGWDGESMLAITPRAQTESARLVGKRRLAQLEGLSEHGVEIKRLVLAIGKTFFEFARDPIGRAPEQNSFVVNGDPASCARIQPILNDGVANLAFEVTAKTKPTSELEMRDDEYRLHPIFCAFFEYSHRRKRRVTFQASSLVKLSTRPSAALAEMMNSGNPTPTDELPTQLAMFTDFYQG